jgi:hypothetical protein
MTYSTDIGIDDKQYFPYIYKHQDFNTHNNYPSLVEQDGWPDLIDLSSEGSLEVHDSESGDRRYIEPSGPTRRRPFQSSYHRQQTAQTRKLTACIRCRMQRIRVCAP